MRESRWYNNSLSCDTLPGRYADDDHPVVCDIFCFWAVTENAISLRESAANWLDRHDNQRHYYLRELKALLMLTWEYRDCSLSTIDARCIISK